MKRPVIVPLLLVAAQATAIGIVVARGMTPTNLIIGLAFLSGILATIAVNKPDKSGDYGRAFGRSSSGVLGGPKKRLRLWLFVMSSVFLATLIWSEGKTFDRYNVALAIFVAAVLILGGAHFIDLRSRYPDIRE